MSAVAKRYADALLSSAGDAGALDAVGEDLTGLAGLIADNVALADFLNNPVLSPQVQTDTLDALFSGKLHELTLRFLHLLVARERLADLPAIVDKALSLWRDAQGILPVTVVSAEDLSGDQASALSKKLAARTGKTIDLTRRTDPGLIGGFQLHFGGVVEDYSLSAKLQTFKRNVLNA